MAVLEDAIYNRLSNFAGLTALVGSGASCRVWPVDRPQDTGLPAVSYTRISGVRVPAMGSDTGLVQSRVQLDCWDSTYGGVKDVAEQVRAALERWSGTVAGVTVQQVLYESDIDLHEPDTETHRVSIDFMFAYEES